MAETASGYERLAELYAKLDRFFASAAARAAPPDGICCRLGCAHCCTAFTVTAVEAGFIARALAALPESERQTIVTAALVARLAVGTAPREERCPALDDAGRCRIYPWRPAICRTHGLVLRLANEEPGPVAERTESPLVCCTLNFAGQALSTIDPALVLDQQTLSTMLAAIDALHAREQGRAWRAERVAIGDVLVSR